MSRICGHDPGKEPSRRPEETKKRPEMMRLINDLSRMFHKEMRKVCEENGVPVGYRSILFHLARRDGVVQKELAEMTGLKASTVSIALDKMERDGYIRRARDEGDGRAVRVYLTPKGLEIDKKNKQRFDELEAQFSSVFEEEERAQLIALLKKAAAGCARISGEENGPFSDR